MSSEVKRLSYFGLDRAYHNNPGKSKLYENLVNVIASAHTIIKEDISVVKDLLKDLEKHKKNMREF